MKPRRRVPLTRRSAHGLKVPAAVALLLIFVPIGPGLFKTLFGSHSTVQAASWTGGTRPAENQFASAPARAEVATATARADLLTSELRSAASKLARVHHVTPSLARRITQLARQRRQALLTVADGNSGLASRTLLSPAARRALSSVRGVHLESPTTIKGTYRIWHRDVPGGKDIFRDELVTHNNAVLLLHGLASGTTPGARIAVSGDRLGNQLMMARASSTQRPVRVLAAASGVTTTGAVNTAVIGVNFTDSSMTAIDMNAIKTNFQGHPGTDVVSFFNEASYGKMSIVPSYYGPYTIAETTAVGCNDSNLFNSVLQAANADIDYTQVRRFVLVLNCPGLGGIASNEGSISTPDGTITAALTELDPQSALSLYAPVHELSHTLGSFNRHAAYFDCIPQAFVAPDRFDQNCDSSEYGDEFDVLGGGPSHRVSELDPYHKSIAGWLDPSQLVTVTGSGTSTYTLTPYETATTGVLALSIPRGQSGSAFTVEYRQPIGFDSWMGSSTSCYSCTVTQGASIRLAPYRMSGGGGGSDTQEIDTTPGSIGSSLYYPIEDARDGALLPGKTFTDPEYGISITTLSASSSGLSVQVSISAAGSCVRGTPTMGSPSPASQTAGPGQAATYSVVVTNTDSAGCAPQRFRYKPDTFSYRDLSVVADPDSFTLAPGASTTLTLSVTSSPSTIDGTYRYSSGAGELDANSLEASPVNAPYITLQVASAADTTAPSVPTSPTATALGSHVVRLSWTASSDNLGVDGYKILRSDGLILTSYTTSAIDMYASAGASYSYSIQAFDHKNNLSAPVSVSVTVPSRTDTSPPSSPAVSATATDRSVTVSWTPSSDNVGVAYYQVQPCIVQSCILPPDARSLTGRGLPTRTRYDFQVVAVDGDGNWSDGNFSKYTVYTGAAGTSAPTQPQQLISTAGVFGRVNLSWKASTDDRGADHYDVYRNNRKIGSTTSTSFSDTGIVTSAEYYVQAVDGDGSLSAPTTRTWFIVPSSASSDTTPPTASISSPGDGASVSGTVSIASSVSDNVGVTKVELYVDGTLKATTTASPWSFSLDTSAWAAGQHWLYLRSYDAAGNYGTAGVTSLTVGSGGGGGGTSDVTPPTVSITAPLTGLTVSGSVLVSATATDNVGVAKVQFSIDGTVVGTSTAAPYGCTWDTSLAATGTHTITATAYDASGNSSASSVTVTVPPPPDTTAPTVAIVAPTNGATISGMTDIQANASDNVAVTKVEVSVDGSPDGTLTAAPYSLPLDTTTLSDGTHTVAVTAYDAAGNNSSDQVAVTVQNVDPTPPPPSDSTLPSTPASLRAYAIGTTQIALHWTASTDNVGVTAYEVYRDGVAVGESAVTNYLDSGLAPASAHTWQVRAKDAAGNLSALSSALSTKTASASTTATTGTISGVVYNQLAKPLGNVIVQTSVNGTLKSAKTNTSGYFRFTSLPPGQYGFTLTLTGYQPATATATAIAGQTVLLVTSLSP